MPYNASYRIRLALPVIALLGLPAAAAQDAPTPIPAAPIDRIVVVVNDDIITASDVETRLQAIRKRLATQKTTPPPDDILRRQVMEHMVMERLQLQRARELGITADNDQVERAIGQIAEQNRTTPQRMRLDTEKEPGGFRAFQNEVRTQILIRQLVEREINNRVFVSEIEVENFLASQAGRAGGIEYNLSHILIALPEKASPEAIAQARQKAGNVLAELQRGANFAQMAISHSQGQNALEGGGIGWKKTGELPDLFINAVRDLEPGKVSDVLRSPNGFHVLRLNDRRGGTGSANVTQTHARHILIKTGELVSVAEAQRRILQLRERLLAGEDFAATARVRSEDIGSAVNGGDLGWVNPGQTVPEFEKVMNALKPGEISEPVRSSFGVHLIQVLERRERDVSHERELTSARNQIRARKADERYEQWLRQLRDEAYVDIRRDPKD
jgi:peptidyl-prolyl cis-trans isomerase SurA